MMYVLLLLGIYVLQGHATLFHCDFEIACSDLEIDGNWSMTRDNDSQLIDYDHTWNNQSGTYLWFKPGNTLAKIKTSSWFQPPSDQAACFNLWYYTSEPQFSLDIELLQGDDENLIRTIHSISGKDPSIIDWTLIHLQLPSETLDDLSVDICDELPLSPPKILFSCDGESSCIKDLISLSNYPYQWSIIQANATIKQENRAPAIDYTLNNELGHYFWLANSDLIEKGNVGYLEINKSFDITDETSCCLSFYYYGYGEQQMSNLKIYARMVERPDIVRALWPKQSSKRYQYSYNKWTWGMINLPRGYYSLLFRMDSQDTKMSSFALDNINITSCDYPPSEFTSSPSFLSFSCHFDGPSMCEIENGLPMALPPFNFTIFTDDTIPNRELGPNRDYTTDSSSGGFFYWNRQSNFFAEDFGIFRLSHTIERNTNMCITFAYYVKSSKNDQHDKTLVLHAATCAVETVWSEMVNDSHGWQWVIIPLQGYACAETFYFGVAHETLSEVSIAFDDIRFEQCSLINTTNIILSTTITTTILSSSTTTVQNNSQAILFFNAWKLIIFYCVFIITGEFF